MERRAAEQKERLSKGERALLVNLDDEPLYHTGKKIAALRQQLRLARQREREGAMDVATVESPAAGASSNATASSRHASKTSYVPVPSICPIGLRNLGRTCYLNVLLQMLYWTKPAREAILECNILESVQVVAEKMSAMSNPPPRCIGDQAASVTPLKLAMALHELKVLFRSMETHCSNEGITPLRFVDALRLSHNHDECALETWTLLFEFYLEYLGIASHFQAEVKSHIKEIVSESSSASPRTSVKKTMSSHISVNPVTR